MLAAMVLAAFAAGATVYVSVSVNGKLEVAAQPVTVNDLTADGDKGCPCSILFRR